MRTSHRSYLSLNADVGQFPGDGLCLVSFPHRTLSDSYDVNVTLRLRRTNGWHSTGSAGVVYNFVDSQNFDFVLFRFHNPNECMRSGYMLHNKLSWTHSITSPCPPSPNPPPSPLGRQFTISLVVRHEVVSVYLDGVFVNAPHPYHPALGSAGAVTENGHNSTLFVYQPIMLMAAHTIFVPAYSALSCHIHGVIDAGSHYAIMTREHVTSNPRTFCRAISPLRIDGRAYDLRVHLGAGQGQFGGSSGVMYSVKDSDNFNFVVFRIHDKDQCYQSGYVLDKVAYWDPAEKCHQVTGQTWFNVTIRVRADVSYVLVDNLTVARLEPYWTGYGRAGVLAPNGVINVVHFKHLQLIAQTLNYASGLEAQQCLEPLAINTTGYYTLETIKLLYSIHDEDSVCRIIAMPGQNYTAYQVTVMLNYREKEPNLPFAVGVIYNAVDRDNFDFTVFRFHNTTHCYQTGYMLHGTVGWLNTLWGACPQTHVVPNQWLMVTAMVQPYAVKVTLNDVEVVKVQTMFGMQARAGVMAFNGIVAGVVYFKGPLITPHMEQYAWHYKSVECGDRRHVINSDVLYTLNTGTGRYLGDGFCRTLSPIPVTRPQYDVTFPMYHAKSSNAYPAMHELGSMGVIYNAYDSNNFDYALFRINISSPWCLQTGTVSFGLIHELDVAHDRFRCPTSRPRSRAWLNVTVRVRTYSADVYLDNTMIAHRRFPWRSPGGAVGVLAYNGYDSTILFRDPIVKIIGDDMAVNYTTYQCGLQGVVNSSSRLELHSSISSNQHKLCRVILPGGLPGRAYDVITPIFNVGGLRNRHRRGSAGVAFNVVDGDNFDFVIFRFSNTTRRCYETGSLVAGNIDWTGGMFGPCPDGPLSSHTWLSVWVYVRAGLVSVYVNGVFAAKFGTRFPARGHVGVVTLNGNANIVHFYAPNITRGQLEYETDYTTHGCSAQYLIKEPDYFVLILSSNTSSPEDLNQFCRVLSHSRSAHISYDFNISLYSRSLMSVSAQKPPVIGLVFNALDGDNFDFVVFRLDNQTSCYRSGHMLHGSPQYDTPHWQPCTTLTPRPDHWLHFTVAVRWDVHSSVWLGRERIGWVKGSGVVGGRVGVLAVEGYGNLEIRVANVSVTQVPLPHAAGYQVYGCGHNVVLPTLTHLILHAGGGTTHNTNNTFCRVIAPQHVRTSNYNLTIQLYNVQALGRDDMGSVGVMYNVHGADDFDFVIFMINAVRTSQCYHTGAVVNGALRMEYSQSGACPTPPSGQTWLTVTVHVRSQPYADVYLDGDLVTRARMSHVVGRGRAGVLVYNGLRNVVHFRQPTLERTTSGSCDSIPCQNAGQCSETDSGFECGCPVGYAGAACDLIQNYCIVSNECRNAAVCQTTHASDGSYGFQCVCRIGYHGVLCDRHMAVCDSDPCANAGTCVPLARPRFICRCQPGYGGALCRRDIDECANQPCQNGASCTDMLDSFKCDCAPGFQGATCADDVNECASSPCMHRGVCTNARAEFHCRCRDGFTGTRCETDTDECTSQPCLNSAQCVDRPQGYMCQCRVGFAGVLCERQVVYACTSSPCDNGGDCIDHGAEYTCRCQSPYTGTQCQLLLHACLAQQPCLNGGSCYTNALLGFYCRCSLPFHGANCELRADDCSRNSPCLNGGHCRSLVPSGHLCDCPHNYTGDHCQIQLNACDSMPCTENATCLNRANGYHCRCPPGRHGLLCDMYRDECALGHCYNGSTCSLTSDWQGYQCHCAAGFTGQHCDTVLNACILKPCQNGGSCLRVGDMEWKCSCHGSYTGDDCSMLVEPCPDHDTPYCANNATCVSTLGFTRCLCPPSYAGLRCDQVDPEACRRGDCSPHGTCIEFSPSEYRCECIPLYTGPLCRSIMDLCLSRPCVNGGTCYTFPGRYLCQCHHGLTGERCQVKLPPSPGEDPCLMNMCANGAACIIVGGTSWYYECVCPEGFRGRHCDEMVVTCLSEPCANDGRCIMSADGSYVCHCHVSFTGVNCERPRPCMIHPCENGGVCHVTEGAIGGFTCTCPSNFIGRRCEMHKTSSACESNPCAVADTCISEEGSNTYVCEREEVEEASAFNKKYAIIFSLVTILAGLSIVFYYDKFQSGDEDTKAKQPLQMAPQQQSLFNPASSTGPALINPASTGPFEKLLLNQQQHHQQQPLADMIPHHEPTRNKSRNNTRRMTNYTNYDNMGYIDDGYSDQPSVVGNAGCLYYEEWDCDKQHSE